ncbi:D-2-hydroxyacid dehydrogenase family protein [Cupriavidus basilensis]|uniref:D-2-hydroxyacid dehydrogenase family protein n=1 Tax=Cupriavidus basilensis TaxID=68895 RepID=UPI0023E89E26|nr:D-2-hydroxyacid dehydrogenase family protein [Cupriavidus basilensis]MDF3883006.1 D-2-hydroxyacid dehydrogenase family protein [Cupriavidus basilensis]
MTDTTDRLKCAVLDDNLHAAASCADWSLVQDRIDVTFFHERLEGVEHVVHTLREFHIVVLMRERTAFGREVIEQLPHLRLIVTAGHRNGALAVEAARVRGIPVLGTPILETPAVELTWALLLALARNVPREVEALRNAVGWQCALGVDLSGATLGLIGLGRLGARVSAIARAFGMHVIAWSQNLREERCTEIGVERGGSLIELMNRSDFVSIHSVLSERTLRLVGPEEIAAMKPSAFLINTSRAPIVDEDALIAALVAGRIAGAGLDVFHQEPLAPDHPYRSLRNVIATPHLGYVTRHTYELVYRSVVEDLRAWLEARRLREVVEEHPARALGG